MLSNECKRVVNISPGKQTNTGIHDTYIVDKFRDKKIIPIMTNET